MILAENISYSYGTDLVLKDVTLNIAAEEMTAIIGPNGAGKSTLLKIIAGILPLEQGKVTIANLSLSKYQRQALAKVIGFVSQSFSSAFDFTVQEIVLMGRYPYMSPFTTATNEDHAAVRHAMEETDVWQFRQRQLSSLSGGEMQRVVLASALAQEPQILLLDEPTSALDLKHQIGFYEILQDLNQQRKMTIVTVTHDINLAARYCRRLLVLKDGELSADGPPAEIINKELMELIYEVPVTISVHPEDGKPLLLPK